MTAYKIKESVNSLLEKGRLFCQFDTYTMLLATPTKPQMFYDGYGFQRMKIQGQVEEVELENEKWVIPHLYKPIRLKLLANN